MYRRLTELLLRGLRVPPEPHPPHGDPASLRVFRAGANFFKLRLARWALTQLLALAGIIFWLGVFIDVEAEVRMRRAQTTGADPGDVRESEASIGKTDAARKNAPAAAMTEAAPGSSVQPPAAAPAKRNRPGVRFYGWAGFKLMLVQLALRLPAWAMPLLWVLKGAGILAYLAQLPVTFMIARLDYEMRWYMVTDRSLRIRHGIWKISESTMSFANIQQVVVSQGPLQRLLGLSDLKVQSAGGGGGDPHERHGREDDMHLGLFHSVTNPGEIRDLILERLRLYRESGLGDPEERSRPAAVPAGVEDSPGELLAAAREFAAEARTLRSALG